MSKNIVGEVMGEINSLKNITIENIINEGISFGRGNIEKLTPTMHKPAVAAPSVNIPPKNQGKEILMDGDSILDQEMKKETTDFDSAVNEIRKIALSSLSKLVDNPLSDEYNFFKKIWAECDKIITDSVKKTSDTTPKI